MTPPDYDDLCKRLRSGHYDCTVTYDERLEAADAIATLREQVAQLEARLRREIHAYDALQKSSDELERSRMSAILQTIGGVVEGRQTASINYLQRLRELVAAERERDALLNIPREPTQEMVKAAWRTEEKASAADMWRAMYDAALLAGKKP